MISTYTLFLTRNDILTSSMAELGKVDDKSRKGTSPQSRLETLVLISRIQN
jgi:hypothetical protein